MEEFFRIIVGMGRCQTYSPYHMSPLVYNSRKSQLLSSDKKQISVAWSWGWREERTVKGKRKHQVTIEMFCIVSVMAAPDVCTCMKLMEFYSLNGFVYYGKLFLPEEKLHLPQESEFQRKRERNFFFLKFLFNSWCQESLKLRMAA